MSRDDRVEVVLETLRRVNKALGSDPNALVASRSGTAADPECAYIELVRELLELIK